MKHISTILLSGFLFFGQYFGSNYTVLEGKEVKYRAGIHLDIETFKKGPVLFVEDETLINEEPTKGNGLHPTQINYKIGLSQRLGDFEAILMNECRHPVDGYSNGAMGQGYGLIELRYHFK